MGLFEDEKRMEEGYFKFERQLGEGMLNWDSFYSLDSEDRQRAVKLMLEKKVLSLDRVGNHAVILADSCRPELSLPLVDEKRIYFTNQRDAEVFYSYLFSKGCPAIRKQR